jgi:hypothetical protein
MLETHRRESDSHSPFVLMRSRLDRIFSALLPARPALQFALACLTLGVGIYFGARYLHPAASEETVKEIDGLKKQLASMNQQMDSTKQLVTYSLLQQQSTGERLKTVLASLDLKKGDQLVVSDLLSALAFDPSVNVRLSALEALYPHAELPAVRSAVAASLPREPSPLVQVTMIDFLAASRDPAVSATLEDVSRSQTYDKAVREAARRALAQL